MGGSVGYSARRSSSTPSPPVWIWPAVLACRACVPAVRAPGACVRDRRAAGRGCKRVPRGGRTCRRIFTSPQSSPLNSPLRTPHSARKRAPRQGCPFLSRFSALRLFFARQQSQHEIDHQRFQYVPLNHGTGFPLERSPNLPRPLVATTRAARSQLKASMPV